MTLSAFRTGESLNADADIKKEKESYELFQLFIVHYLLFTVPVFLSSDAGLQTFQSCFGVRINNKTIYERSQIKNHWISFCIIFHFDFHSNNIIICLSIAAHIEHTITNFTFHPTKYMYIYRMSNRWFGVQYAWRIRWMENYKLSWKKSAHMRFISDRVFYRIYSTPP